MNKGVEKIRELRNDLTPYFFHFMKKKENLDCILNEKRLISDKGYLCFTEMPLVSSQNMFNYFANFRRPMYTPYGIGIKREILIDKFNISPVLYVKNEKEKNLIDPILHWNTEIINDLYDFQWLREWRINMSVLDLSLIHDIMIIIPDDINIPRSIIANDKEIIDSSEFNKTFPNYSGFLYNKEPAYRIFKLEDISCIENDFQIDNFLRQRKKEQFNL